MPTATDVVWETYPQCPINNTLVVRDALTALTNVSYLFSWRFLLNVPSFV